MADHNVKVHVSTEGTDEASSRLKKFTMSVLSINATMDLLKKGMHLVSEAFTDAKNSYESVAGLEAVLKSTGGAAGMTMEKLDGLTKSLEENSTAHRSVIRSTEGMLLTFTNIKDNIFPEVAQAALDMSVRFKTEPTQAAIQLGKAMQDPIRGFMALRRVGVALTEQQKVQIEKFVQSGDILSAQKIILKEVQTEFGGLSKAVANTPTGKIQQMARSFEEVKIEMSKLIVEAIQPLMEPLKKIAEIISKIFENPALKKAINDVVNSLAEIIVPIIESLGPIFEELLPIVTDVLKIASELIVAILKPLQPLLKPVIDIIKMLVPIIRMAADFVSRILEALSPLLLLLSKMLIDILTPLMPLIKAILNLVISLTPVLNIILPIVAKILEIGVKVVMAVVNPIVDAIRFIIEKGAQAVDFIASIFGGGEEKKPAQKAQAIAAHGNEQPAGVIPFTGTPTGYNISTMPKGGGKKELKGADEQARMYQEEWDAYVKGEREAAEKRVEIEEERINRVHELALAEFEQYKQLELEKAQFNVRMHDMLRDLKIDTARDDQQRMVLQRDKELDILQDQYDQEMISFEVFEASRQKVTEQYEKSRADFMISSTNEIMNNLSTAGEVFFGSNKSIAVAQAAISTWVAANKALEAGPIIGPILMAATIVAGLANVAKIVATSPGSTPTGGGGGGVQTVNLSNAKIPTMNSMARGNMVQISGQFTFKDGALYAQIQKDVALANQKVL